ncbi:hypothetical protein PRZ48_005413 [Zasmidium cellare]|uniref:Polyketide synthase n=1 Tax=Zasmidium cellare TaxID=395010 RepID=A0ABR0ESC2_ZASCE|nr:hypothetical protein PRZ48_005413 [Zasmidium cellare]
MDDPPSLLVFGSQSEPPSTAELHDCYAELCGNPSLTELRQQARQLPEFWQRLVDFDPALNIVPGAEYLDLLARWANGKARLPLDDKFPNHFVLAITILLQVTQYTRYLRRIGPDAQQRVLNSVRSEGSVQGLCVGFLSAIAIAGSISESEIGSHAALALRLAVSAGAYVDQDGQYSATPTEYATVAVRWSGQDESGVTRLQGLVREFSEGYISTVNDDTSVTITLPAETSEAFAIKANEMGMYTKPLAVHGRFHTTRHSDAVQKLLRFFETSNSAKTRDLQVPVRDTATGKAIVEACTIRLALENVLANVSDWYTTIEKSISASKRTKQTILCVGGYSCIPASLSRSGNVRVVAINGRPHSSERTNGNLRKLPNGSDEADHGTENGITTNQHDYHDQEPNHDSSSDDLSQYPPHAIAVVGMAGRFPEADTLDDLWELMMEGRSTVKAAPIERLGLSHGETKWWGNFLNDPTSFDNKFFNKSSREALAWDPQQRILLEVIYEALESAGYFGASGFTEPRDYGCYIGAVMNNYYDNLSCHPATAYATVGTSRCYLSGAMSHHFGWTGPALTIDTACSSSLVAIHSACQAIWAGDCSRAVAGGTNVISSPFDYQNLAAAGFLSPSGQCKPFDAAADGYCRGEGVGVVVLKRLSDALKENDDILGVIVGSAANQNHNCGAITAPDSNSQVDVFQTVARAANVDAESVSYVEAHGTGTGVGDPTEVRSIRKSFGRPTRSDLLHFGSIKGNIGHTEATAGVAGLIKVLMMMRHRTITPQASHRSLNPKIPPLEHDRMKIAREPTRWSASTLLACVNSYGAAGSNSAVMIQEAPRRARAAKPTQLKSHPVFISAASPDSLSRYCQQMLRWLRGRRDTSPELLSSLAFNLANRGNHSLSHVLAFAGSSLKKVEAKLGKAAYDASGAIHVVQQRKPVILVFGGQESVHIGLSESIYRSSKLFRQHLESVDNLLVQTGHASIFPSIFQETSIEDTVLLHSTLFAIQYASARTWIDCSLEISAVVGHSFGFLTALCISGVLSLSDALTLVVGRASLIETHWGEEKGSMLSMQCSRSTGEELITSFLAETSLYAEIACYNGPENHAVVGSSAGIEALQEYALSRDVRTRLLNVTNGFHSHFTEPMLPHLSTLAARLQWNAPKIHIESTERLPKTSKPNPSMIAEHTRNPVFFQNAIERLTDRFGACTWLEAGRGSSVIQLVKRSVGNVSGHEFHSPQLCSRAHAQDSLTDVTVDLWKSGHNVQYWPFHRMQKSDYQHLSLPPYQFEKSRHWLGFKRNDPSAQGDDSSRANPLTTKVGAHELLRFIKYPDTAEKEAEFSIDPGSNRFQEMVNGHVMAGEPLAPASLFFELAAQAALFLQHDVLGETFVPTVDDLTMTSPIGRSESKHISMILKRQGETHPAWSFSITTTDLSKASAISTDHVKGIVRLRKRTDTEKSRQFGRYETLIGGSSRNQELLNNPESEKMHGKHIYRAFSTVVSYGEPFHGIKEIACLGNEAVGKVRRATCGNQEGADSHKLYNTPLIDSFMQFAGFLVNYFHNPSIDDVFVCGKIDQVTVGGAWDPNSGEWLVHSFMEEEGKHVSVDVYVTDAKTGKMVMTAFGFRFSKMQKSTLGRLLKAVNQSSKTNGAVAAAEVKDDHKARAVEAPAPPPPAIASKRQEIIQILSNVTDVPVDKIRDETTLDELGIDSLMAVEVLNDLRSATGLTIELPKFLLFDNIGVLVRSCDERLGLAHEPPSRVPAPESIPSEDNASTDFPHTTHQAGSSTPDSIEPPSSVENSSQTATILSASSAFDETRLSYDHHAETTQAVGFWQDAYPLQARLVLAYVVEAFAELGCDLNTLSPGSIIPPIDILPRHRQLLHRLHLILQDGGLISSTEHAESYTRTNKPLDPTPAETIYTQIINTHPQHDIVLHLLKAMGCKMAACLCGDMDPLQILFGDEQNKKLQEELYESWPLLRTPALVLADFLARAITTSPGNGKVRILEIGAGTGGTTKVIFERLRGLGVEFEYVVTDISSSLLNTTAKHFARDERLRFERLDIEQPPRPSYLKTFHFIIATNCIHATRDLHVSLGHARRMLRDDGALALIEITREMFWLDVVVGLLRGWWAFGDGRGYALVDERGWEGRMRGVGFGGVGWSGGESEESGTVRVIAAFPQKGLEAGEDNPANDHHDNHHRLPTPYNPPPPPRLTITPTLHHDTYPFISPLTHPAPPSKTSVLITGASKGIGLATALSFARAGFSRIAILARSNLSSAASQIISAAGQAGRAKPEVLELRADISDLDAGEAAMDEVGRKWDHLDILINNASLLSSFAHLGESSPKEWWRTWEVNIKGTYLVTRAALPLLLKSTLKTIVTISSGGAFISLPGASAYQGTKAAQIKMTEDLMLEYGGQGLLAYSVHPCATETESTTGKVPGALLRETAELAGDTVVWLTRERREWLAGRFVFGTQDMGELEGMTEEVLERGLLRVGLVV